MNKKYKKDSPEISNEPKESIDDKVIKYMGPEMKKIFKYSKYVYITIISIIIILIFIIIQISIDRNDYKNFCDKEKSQEQIQDLERLKSGKNSS